MNGQARGTLSQTDLHLHSSVSPDGEISPRGLAELCCQRGVTLAALTDHNSIAGTEEFIWRSAQLGVRAISGIELDCTFGDRTLHVLGYGIHIADMTLLVRGVRMENYEIEDSMLFNRETHFGSLGELIDSV